MRISGAARPFQVYHFLQHLINWSAIFSPALDTESYAHCSGYENRCTLRRSYEEKVGCRGSLLVLSCSVVSMAAPLSLGLLTLNDQATRRRIL